MFISVTSMLRLSGRNRLKGKAPIVLFVIVQQIFIISLNIELLLILTSYKLKQNFLVPEMVLDEAVIDDGEFNMDELITFNRPHSDHDYQVVKSLETHKVLPGGYADLPIDEDWPPNLKKRMKKLEFDYEDGRDYLPPIVKEEKYENFYNRESKFEQNDLTGANNGLLTNTLISTGRKLGELLDVFPPIPVKNEDILIEEISDYDTRNITEVKSFVVNGTMNEF